MTDYAQTLIEADGKRFDVGDPVPKDLPGIDELKDAGAVGPEKASRELAAGDGGQSSEGVG